MCIYTYNTHTYTIVWYTYVACIYKLVNIIGQYRNSEPFNVTFPAGDSCVQFDVPIKDSMSEDNETNNFTLIINPSSLPSNIIVSDPSQATVIIRDNCKYRKIVIQ